MGECELKKGVQYVYALLFPIFRECPQAFGNYVMLLIKINNNNINVINSQNHSRLFHAQIDKLIKY